MNSKEAKENNNRIANHANNTLEAKAIEYLSSLTEQRDEIYEEEELTTTKLNQTGTLCFKDSQQNSKPQSIRHISKQCIVIDHMNLKPRIQARPILIPTAYPTQYQRGYDFREFTTALQKYHTTKGIWRKAGKINSKDEDSSKCFKSMNRSPNQTVGANRRILNQINYNETRIDQLFKIRVRRSVSLQEQSKGRLLSTHSQL